MMISVNELLDRGVALKRAGKLEEAKGCYMKALEADPGNMMTFISLGKTAHLLGAQDLAVRCYLASAHLQLSPIENGIQTNNLPMHLKFQYDSFPKDVLKQLPRKSAFVIFIDPNTPRHVSHSIIDLSPDLLKEHPHLKPYGEVYHAHILGDGTYNQVLMNNGLTASEQTKTDEQVYIPYGRNFLINELKWDKLSRNDVITLYF